MIPRLFMNASLHLVVVASIMEIEGRLFYLNKVGKDVWFPKKYKAMDNCEFFNKMSESNLVQKKSNEV